MSATLAIKWADYTAMLLHNLWKELHFPCQEFLATNLSYFMIMIHNNKQQQGHQLDFVNKVHVLVL